MTNEGVPVQPTLANPPTPPPPYQARWVWVLALIGLDYFSTLSYQPSIAYQAAGLLTPFATAVVVLVTLGAALPVYAHVAARSPNGQGSMGVFERMVPGWRGKTLILILLGFAATDFIFTRTFSAADAAVHLLGNPHATWQRMLDYLFDAGNVVRPWSSHPLWLKAMTYWNKQMVATLLLLLTPFIPGLRDIPRLIPIHRLIWRSWDRTQAGAHAGAGPVGSAHTSRR